MNQRGRSPAQVVISSDNVAFAYVIYTERYTSSAGFKGTVKTFQANCHIINVAYYLYYRKQHVNKQYI